ncbi:MAG: acetate/propionate family kinase [Bradyrhizobiaceae bacterium]|nr:acetate/propionate family kinase [Bradyrhizobiaceae bacterium]
MNDPILVINAGSSSIKFSVFETLSDREVSATADGEVAGIGPSARLTAHDSAGRVLVDRLVSGKNHDEALGTIRLWFTSDLGSGAGFDGVGHRVVHGGLGYAEPVLIDGRVIADLDELIPLAPLHQPHNIAGIRAIASSAPDVLQVACFDTAFHRTQSEIAQQYGLPRALSAKGIRRYGFHGLSYEYIVSVLPKVMPEFADGRLVVAHLGNGASMCAIHHGRSVANTMGFSTVEGLLMGTRTGTLDPGVILYLLQHEDMNPHSIEHLIYEQSGLLGVSGVSSDMRALLASDEPSARNAIDLFVYRIKRELGSLVAALGGLDALVFTAGIGEHSPDIRARICQDAGWLGIILDEEANAKNAPRISTPESQVSAWTIPTNENLIIARHTRQVIDRKRNS